jgi:hypothetical protein
MNGCRSVLVASTVNVDRVGGVASGKWQAAILQGQRMMTGDTQLQEREKERKLNLPAASWMKETRKTLAG